MSDQPRYEMTFLVSGQDARGEAVARFVPAKSARAALDLVTDEGWREIALHEDETTAMDWSINVAEAERNRARVPKRGSPAESIRVRYAPQRETIVTRVITLVPAGFLFWVPVIVPAFLFEAPTFWWVLAGVVVAGLAIQLPLSVLRPRILFARAVRDTLEGEGRRALRNLNRLQKSLRQVGATYAVGTLGMATQRARALAVAGDLAGALAELERLRVHALVPEWLYQARRMLVLIDAYDHQGAIRAGRRALELGPDCGSIRCDLALQLALRAREPAAARAMLARAEKLPLPVPQRGCVHLIQAIIALEEKEPEAADRALTAADEAFAPYREGPGFTGMLRIAAAMRALTLAKLGRHAEAAPRLGEVEAQLEARRDLDLVARIRAARD